MTDDRHPDSIASYVFFETSESEAAVYAHLYAEEDRLRRAVTRARSDLVMAEIELQAFLSKHTSQTSLPATPDPVESNSSKETESR